VVLAGETASVPSRVGVSLAQTRLTLQQAIEMALASNLDIENEKSNLATAEQAVRGSHGFYDPRLRWLPSLVSENDPSPSVLQGSDGKLSQHVHSENFDFLQNLPWQGASVDLTFDNSRVSATNPFLSLNPYLTSQLSLTFTQPLLRGRETDAGRTEIKIRRKQQDESEAQFETRVIDVVTRVEQAYWDLVAARQDADVKAESVTWAREHLARVRRMIDAGEQASVELSAAEAELERRLDTWYASVGAITETENALKTMITDSPKAELWTDEIVPVEEKAVAPPNVDDYRAVTAVALKQRPELKQVAARQGANDAQKHQNADLVKPQLNLVAGYTSTGVAGSLQNVQDPLTSSITALYGRVNELSAGQGLPALVGTGLGATPGALMGGYGTSLSNLFDGRYQTVQVGLAFDLTFRNRRAEADLAQSVIAERRLKLEQAQTEQAIQAQVRNALQAIQTAEQRMTAADASARAAKEKLDSEIRMFQTGESTNFLVLTRQNEYADSRHRVVAATVDFNKAVAALEQAEGTTLKEHGVGVK
jgi:HAE1 family hydrophobic/amphiphilic exporter-1